MPGHDPRRVIPLERKPKGPNKIARDLKNGIIEAAENLGSDGEGTGGLVGYLEFLGKKHPKAFAGLLAKVLPMQVTATVSNSMVGTVKIVTIPSGNYLSSKDMVQLQEPHTIDVIPEQDGGQDG